MAISRVIYMCSLEMCIKCFHLATDEVSTPSHLLVYVEAAIAVKLIFNLYCDCIEIIQFFQMESRLFWGKWS